MRSAQTRAQGEDYKAFPSRFDGNPLISRENASGKIPPIGCRLVANAMHSCSAAFPSCTVGAALSRAFCLSWIDPRSTPRPFPLLSLSLGVPT